MLPLPRHALRAAFVLLAACDPDAPDELEDPAEPVDLVDPEAWLATPAALDPLPDHRPISVLCPPSAQAIEFGLLEVDTGQCNYLSVSQPLARPLAVGDPLRVTVWWQALIAEAPAEGHLALLIADELLWETHVAIPGEAELRQIEFESSIAAEAGDVLTFHLHNHGYNSWTFGGLELLDDETTNQR